MDEQLRTGSPLLRQLGKTYNETSINGIIEQYTRARKEAKKLGEYWRDKVQREQQFVDERALECLEEILHKKLFNAQCLWRAGQLELPIKNTWEIRAYAHNIFRCSFLEPITREELDEYIRYWLSDSFSDFPKMIAQEHDRLKAYATGQKYQTLNEVIDDALYRGAHYPHWYAWYDEHFDTKSLLYLEDQRGYKERVLIMAFKKSRNQGNFEAAKEAWKTIHLRKSLIALPGQLHDFAAVIGDVRMLPYFKRLDASMNSVENSQVEEALLYLNDVYYRSVPVKAHADWRMGVVNAAYEDLQTRALKRLPGLYEEYLQENYFYDKHYDEAAWTRDQRTVEAWQQSLEEGRKYMEGNPGEFEGY